MMYALSDEYFKRTMPACVSNGATGVSQQRISHPNPQPVEAVESVRRASIQINSPTGEADGTGLTDTAEGLGDAGTQHRG